MLKRVAIVQSSYVPWKGFFDLIRAVDEFILLDDVQFTKRDWRSRNRIKTKEGSAWLTIPVHTKGQIRAADSRNADLRPGLGRSTLADDTPGLCASAVLRTVCCRLRAALHGASVGSTQHRQPFVHRRDRSGARHRDAAHVVIGLSALRGAQPAIDRSLREERGDGIPVRPERASLPR